MLAFPSTGFVLLVFALQLALVWITHRSQRRSPELFLLTMLKYEAVLVPIGVVMAIVGRLVLQGPRGDELGSAGIAIVISGGILAMRGLLRVNEVAGEVVVLIGACIAMILGAVFIAV